MLVQAEGLCRLFFYLERSLLRALCAGSWHYSGLGLNGIFSEALSDQPLTPPCSRFISGFMAPALLFMERSVGFVISLLHLEHEPRVDKALFPLFTATGDRALCWFTLHRDWPSRQANAPTVGSPQLLITCIPPSTHH